MRLFPLRFIPDKSAVDFIGKRWWGFAFSIALTLLSFGFIMGKGLNLGIDFTGGVLMEMRTQEPADLAAMREALSGKGLGEVSLQNFGDVRDVMLRIQIAKDARQEEVVETAKSLLAGAHATSAIEYRKIEFVGPTVGNELLRGAGIAVALSFLAIMIYVWFRFEWQFGAGAIAALLHDAIMMVGFYAVTGFEFGLTAIAAILTIIGYSINDSVVIYDRIRENLRRYKKMPIEQLLNLSINDTLSRTVMTSTTTLLAALALALYGGEVIRGFSWSLVFGIAVGTYSSIYISAPALIYLAIRPAQGAGEQPAAHTT